MGKTENEIVIFIILSVSPFDNFPIIKGLNAMMQEARSRTSGDKKRRETKYELRI